MGSKARLSRFLLFLLRRLVTLAEQVLMEVSKKRRKSLPGAIPIHPNNIPSNPGNIYTCTLRPPGRPQI